MANTVKAEFLETPISADATLGSIPAMADIYALTLLAQDSGSSGGNSIFSLAIFAALPLGLYFLLIRPQRKRQRESAALQASIGVGDEVITTSGIYGFITGEEGTKLWLEIDDDVQIRIARAAIQRKVDPEAEAEDDEREAADGKRSLKPSSDSSATSDGEGDNR